MRATSQSPHGIRRICLILNYIANIIVCFSLFFKVAVALGVIGKSVDPAQIDKHCHVKLHLRLLDQLQLAKQANQLSLHGQYTPNAFGLERSR